MKRLFYYVLFIALVATAFTSCTKDEETFEETLLIGKWKGASTNNEANLGYYRYNADHTGAIWNPADDIQESEGTSFTWKLDKSTLTQMHIMVSDPNLKIPKIYTVTKLNATTLEYKDDNGKQSSFTKE